MLGRSIPWVEVEDAAFTMVASFSLLAHRGSPDARSASVGDLHPDVPPWMGSGIITGYVELDRSDPNYSGNRTLDLDLRLEVVARRTSHTDSLISYSAGPLQIHP